MNTAIISVNKIDVDRITFVQGPTKPGRIPGINIKYNGQNLALRIPRIGFPFGASAGMNNDGPATNLTAPLKNCDPHGVARADDSNEIGRFYNFLLDLQSKVLDTAVENRIKWFPLLPNGKKPSESDIRNSMKPLFRLHTTVDASGERVPSGKYPPNVSFKVPVYDNRVSMDIIDGKGNDVYVTPNTLGSVFHKGSEANLVASPSIYVMAGGVFGVTWRLTYAQVFPQQRVTAKNVFADEIEDEDDVPVESDAPAPAPAPAPARTFTSEETALDIEIPDEDATPAPAPADPVPSGRKRRTAVA